MRMLSATLAALLLATGVGGLCAAQEASAPASQPAPDGYHGRYLHWAGKSAAPTPRPPAAPASPVAPPPSVTRAQEAATPLPPAAPPREAAVYAPAPSRQVAAPRTPAPAVSEAPPRSSAPLRKASATKPARRRTAHSAPTLAKAHEPAAREPSSQQPRAFAENAAPAPPSAPVHVRFYSLDRAYGLQPDPIPIPKRHPYVLIAPADTASADKSAKDEPADADASKPSGEAGGGQTTP